MGHDSEITAESISEQLSELWNELTRNQRRFAVAMQEHPTKKDAAISIGLEPDTVYRWNGIVDDVVELLSNDVAAAAYSILESYGTKAAMIKVGGLDSDTEKVRQDSSSEILDRIMGRPTQRNELTGADGDAFEVTYIDYRVGITKAKE